MDFEQENIIDGMIYSADIDKWVSIQEYIEYAV